MATDKEIGERLKAARIAAGFTTAADAATALGIKYPTYAGHENGSRGLRSSLEQYGRRYRVTMDWLLTGRGPGPKSRPLIAPFGQVPLRGYIGADRLLRVDLQRQESRLFPHQGRIANQFHFVTSGPASPMLAGQDSTMHIAMLCSSHNSC